MVDFKLKLAVVVTEMFGENCYIASLEGRNDAIVVDPGFDHPRIFAYLDQQGVTPAAIINTHGHADHIGGNGPLKQRWPDCPLVIGSGDAVKLTDPRQNLSRGYGLDITSPPADQLVREGDVYSAAGIDLEVLETPGHSAGHVVFVLKQAQPWLVFGGDVLFQGGVGRADLPDGNMDQLTRSIREKLYLMPDETIVLPGHGPQTTIGDEKRHNPFVPA